MLGFRVGNYTLYALVPRNNVGANYAGVLLSSICHSQLSQRIGRPGSCTVTKKKMARELGSIWFARGHLALSITDFVVLMYERENRRR